MTRLEFTKNSLSPGLKQIMPTLRKNIYQVLRFHEGPLLAKAKVDAPWKDQTGNARNGLSTTVVVMSPNVYALVLFHTVDYGLWLEVRFAGKYAVIKPTITAYTPLVFASLTKLLDRMDVSGSVG